MAYLEEVDSSQLVANSVTNAKLSEMATLTIKGNDTGGSADPQDLTVNEVSVMLINDSGSTTSDLLSASKIISLIAAAAASEMSYKGGYNASTNTPDLDSSPIDTGVGDMYTVTAAGTFFTIEVEVGDVIIAETLNATTEAEWTIVQKNENDVVSGPAGATTDSNVAFWDGTSGRLLKDNSITLTGTNTGDEVSATDSTEGIVELATQAEVNTGSDTTRVLTPATFAGSTAVGQITGVVTVHSDVSDAGSGAIITTVERAKLDRPVVTKVAGDSPYAASISEIVNYETAAGASQVDLPAGATGAIISVKMGAGTNLLTVDANSTETIDGALTFTTTQPFAAFNFVWNGTEWMVM